MYPGRKVPMQHIAHEPSWVFHGHSWATWANSIWAYLVVVISIKYRKHFFPGDISKVLRICALKDQVYEFLVCLNALHTMSLFLAA